MAPARAHVTVVISSKELAAKVTAMSKTYDGTTTAEIIATVSTGIDGETLTIIGLTGTFDDANVGADKTVTVNSSAAVIAAGANTNKDNYTVSFPITTTASIIAKAPEDDDPTAINGFKTDDGAVDTYDLRGRKMDPTNLRKGLYIRNGKKIVIR
jgi:hypothetical protein